MIFEYDFPWFPQELSPNARANRYAKNETFQWYKQQCFYMAQGATPNASSIHKYAIEVMFYPPCGRKRDLDNCYAAIKAGLDGLAMAIGVDDSQFRPVTLDFGEKEKGGRINVKVFKHEKL